MVPNYFSGRPQRAKDSSKIDVWGPNENHCPMCFFELWSWLMAWAKQEWLAGQIWPTGCSLGSGGTRIFFFFLWGSSRGQNAYLKGQKSKKLLKMAVFCHFLLGGASGDRSSNWGENALSCPHLVPPLSLGPLPVRVKAPCEFKIVAWTL